MKKLKVNTFFKVGTHLIILGCMFGILFGQGTHLHNLAFHVDGHLDMHASVHAHSQDDSHINFHKHHNSERQQDKGKHEHNVHTFDVDGILVSPVKVATDLRIQHILMPPVMKATALSMQRGPSALSNLPPPDKPVHQYYSHSFSLRGPPVA